MKMQPKAWRSAKLFENGVGTVVVARFKSDGRVEVGFFLVDVWCLGVKDAGFRRIDSGLEFEEFLLAGMFSNDEPMEIAPEAGRKLVEDAVEYAAGLGFAPCCDYKLGCRVFGGINATACEETFVFGSDGKPLFVQGPFDSPERCDRILRTLEARCGRDGFHYILLLADLSDDLDDDGTDASEAPEILSETAPSPGLQSLLDRIHVENPETKVIFSPPDRKVSDMITAVAEPFLETAEDADAVREIIHLAVLAWNYTLLPARGQREMLDLFAESDRNGQASVTFALLVMRSISLFPDHRPAIHHFELDEDAAGELNLRVVSTPPEAPRTRPVRNRPRRRTLEFAPL